MEVHFALPELSELDGLKCDAIAVACCADERPPQGVLGLVDWRLCGLLSKMMMRGRITGEPRETVLVPVRQRLNTERLLLFGAGPSGSQTSQQLDELMQHMLASLCGVGARTAAMVLPGRWPVTVEPEQAIERLLAAATKCEELDQVWVVEPLEAQRLMAPVVARERRRARALL